jgi:hypothetical protein
MASIAALAGTLRIQHEAVRLRRNIGISVAIKPGKHFSRMRGVDALALGHQLRVFQAGRRRHQRRDRHEIPAAVVFDFLEQVGPRETLRSANPPSRKSSRKCAAASRPCRPTRSITDSRRRNECRLHRPAQPNPWACSRPDIRDRNDWSACRSDCSGADIEHARVGSRRQHRLHIVCIGFRQRNFTTFRADGGRRTSPLRSPDRRSHNCAAPKRKPPPRDATARSIRHKRAPAPASALHFRQRLLQIVGKPVRISPALGTMAAAASRAEGPARAGFRWQSMRIASFGKLCTRAREPASVRSQCATPAPAEATADRLRNERRDGKEGSGRSPGLVMAHLVRPILPRIRREIPHPALGSATECTDPTRRATSVVVLEFRPRLQRHRVCGQHNRSPISQEAPS